MSNLYFGDRLHKLRKSRGLSLEEVALGVGVTSSHISQLENGKRNPSFSLISALSNYFDVDPTFLMETKNMFFGHGEKICAFREAKGISLVELALRADIEPAHLLKVENGQARLKKEELQRVAQILGKSIIDFNDAISTHLNTIREICLVIFNMDAGDIEELIQFIEERIN